MKQYGMVDEFRRLGRLSELGDPLEKVSSRVDFELFRPLLNKVFYREDKKQTGRPAYDYVMMFKILLLQLWYNMPDDKAEYIINDRISFQRFLGISLGHKVPDSKTIWHFRERLTQSGVEKDLFALFGKMLEELALITRSGSIVDASFVEVPRQRNTRKENAEIKEGKTPEAWLDKPHKLCQKDVDARWTKKDKETYYGYKDHIKVDNASKLIVAYRVTAASVHDSEALVGLIDERDKELFADSAYTGKKLHRSLLEKVPSLSIKVHEKGYRNKPLTEEQKVSNRIKSKVRVRVEHIFGHFYQRMGGLFIRCIGIVRVACIIGLKNLVYNIDRLIYLRKVGTSFSSV